MVEGFAQEWFLEVEGRKTGPFSTDQVLGLLADKEIPETQRVTSSTLGDHWITVKEMAERHSSSPNSPNTGRPFVPPPRPADLRPSNEIMRDVIEDSIPAAQESKTEPAPHSSTTKPELSLFDALLAAKERKAQANRAIPPQITPSTPNPFRLQNIPRKAWAVGAVAALLCVALWGMVHFVKQRAARLEASHSSSPVSGAQANVAPRPNAMGNPTLPAAPHSFGASRPGAPLSPSGAAIREVPSPLNQEPERDVAENDAPPPPPPPLPPQNFRPAVLPNGDIPSAPPPPGMSLPPPVEDGGVQSDALAPPVPAPEFPAPPPPIE